MFVKFVKIALPVNNMVVHLPGSSDSIIVITGTDLPIGFDLIPKSPEHQ